MFSNNIRTLYLYIVAFLALMGIIFGVVNLVEKITNYLYPVDYYSSYSETYPIKEGYTTVQEDNTVNINLQRQNSQTRTLREIFTSIAVILVSAPLYSYHWIMIQKERKKEEV